MNKEVPFSPQQEQSMQLQCCMALAKRSMPGNYVYVLLFLSMYWVVTMCAMHQDAVFYMGLSLIVLCVSRGYIAIQVQAWQHHLKAWTLYFSLLSLSIASLWTTLVLHQWLEFGLNEYTMLLLLLIMGMIYGALPVLSIHSYLFRAFATILLLPLIIFGFFQQDIISTAVSGIFFIGLFFSINISNQLRTEFMNHLQLKTLMQIKEVDIQRLADRAQAESKAKSTFLANMSHEIRTPMNGVVGMTEMLQQTQLNHQQEAYVQVIHRSSHALIAIINDILDYSKIESGHLHIESLPFNLREMVSEVIAVLIHQKHAPQLEVILNISPDIPNAFIGDAARLRQMLINLLSNAFKFTQEGEVRITIAPDNIDQQAGLCFSIQDTGIGIPALAQKDIFDSFAQADNSTTRRFGGTGLGLAICAQLAQLMGGQLQLKSQEGEGSCFFFSIPLTTNPQPLEHDTIDLRLFNTWASQYVLVVDDNQHTREALIQQLSAWGLSYLAVDSAFEAWQTLSNPQATQTCHTVLLDMHMPGIQGLELANMIRDYQPLTATRLIMLCADESDVTTIHDEQTRIDAYIHKPIEQTALFQALTASAQHLKHTTQEVMPQSNEKTHFESLHILIAEDNRVNQEVLMAMLDLVGCTTTLANNGLEVLAALENKTFDLILMDCHMPQMDGLEATKQIRQRQGDAANIPIIALTANAMPEDRERCLNAGMNAYLSKPFTQQQLHHIIEQYQPNKTSPTAWQPPSTQQCLDQSCLENLRQLQQKGSPNIVHKIMHMFLKDAPRYLHTMRQSLHHQDMASLKIAAHTLKSSSANVGATQLSTHCCDLETLADKPEQHTQLFSLLEQAESDFTMVQQEILEQHTPIQKTAA